MTDEYGYNNIDDILEEARRAKKDDGWEGEWDEEEYRDALDNEWEDEDE